MARPREFDIDRALDHAMRTFWQRGYHATSVADLMDSLGIQKQSLYSAFGDKLALFLKAIELYREQTVAQVRALLADAPSPLVGLESVMRFAVSSPRLRHCPEGCLAANTALELGLTDPAAAREVKRLFDALETLFRDSIQQAQRSGQISKSLDARSTARNFVNTLNGIRVAEKAGTPRKHLEALVDSALAVLHS